MEDPSKTAPPARLKQFFWLLLALLPYLLYLGFILSTGRGPVDFETFLAMGARLVSGDQVYTENAYYPLPYVMVFAALSLLPRALAMLLWFGFPLAAALAITRFSPLVLLYAPLFGHFTGGQSSGLALLGLWGYRRACQQLDQAAGGVWLGVLMLKPQLGLLPLGWAAWQWLQAWRSERRIPRQALAWLATSAALYLPAFILQPDWIFRWLSTPRPLFERALAGLLPRSLLTLLPSQGWAFWMLWLAGAAGLLWLTWKRSAGKKPFDLALLWYFTVSPLVHDYDLIQLIPALESRASRLAAVLLSLPGWLVILFAYGNDSAWFAFTLIAPGLLVYWLARK